MHGLSLIAGSGNVYADLGHDDADEMLAKAQLATKIGEIIKARKWPQQKAAAVLGMTPAELRELLAGRFRGHSLDDLERLASRIEK
ncbi:XRE family transcriptional regulator [Escherichia coli]|nr:XRE family transcriptional regulator [Escherichia coli]EFA5127532.1 XRE family transcriptional regulator [Escherichia coli]